MSLPPEDLPQPIYEDPSLTPPPAPPPGGQYATPNYGAPATPVSGGPAGPATPPGGQYPVPGYVPPPPPGGVHGYAPPTGPGGAASASSNNKLPLIIAAVIGVIAVIAVLIAVMVGGEDKPTPEPNPPKTTGKDGPGPTDASVPADVVAGINVLITPTTSDEQKCIADAFGDQTDILVKLGKTGGATGDPDEGSLIAGSVTSCMPTSSLVGPAIGKLQQEEGFTYDSVTLSCVQSSLEQLTASDFRVALEALYTAPGTNLLVSFDSAISGCF